MIGNKAALTNAFLVVQTVPSDTWAQRLVEGVLMVCSARVERKATKSWSRQLVDGDDHLVCRATAWLNGQCSLGQAGSVAGGHGMA